ncbi:MAG: hypothetical protein HY776_05090, partial [Actinobacteria bacterium]|nr:hypothetical protein [Actinomycetota bacterium]
MKNKSVKLIFLALIALLFTSKIALALPLPPKTSLFDNSFSDSTSTKQNFTYPDFSETLTKGIGFKYSSNQNYVDFRINNFSNSSSPIQLGDKVIFTPDPNINITYTVFENKVKEEIILNKKPKTNRFTFSFEKSKGLKLVKKEGGFHLIDISNSPIFIVQNPVTLDKNKNGGPTSLEIKENQAILTVSQDFLDKAAYPVKIDPTIITNDNPDFSVVGYWPLNEGTGSTVYDKSPANNNGTIYGASWTQGKYGQALSFDGIDDYMQVPNSTSLNITDQLTAEAWVKLSSLGNTQTIINKSVYNLNGWRAFIDGYNKINFEVINGMDYLIQSSDSIDTNWHYLAFTYDGYNGRIYKDGKEIWAYLPHDNLSPVEYYGNDGFSDSNGNRVWPWGIEVWAGTPSSYFDGGQVRLIGNSPDDANVLAIPGYSHKPKVKEGLDYTQSFDVKLENVSGNGVRIIHQWFNANQEIIGTDYGTFETGTSDWHTLSLTKTAPTGAVRGDIIIELYGSGALSIKNPKFYLTDVNARKITTNTQNLTLGETTDHYWKFNGLIDDVKIYNWALSVVEVASPASDITLPLNNSLIEGTTYTITGTASDTGSSNVSQVEVSTDNGVTWNLATNTGTNYSTWEYNWALPADGTYTLKSRAKDSVGNIETPASINVTVNNTAPITTLTTIPATPDGSNSWFKTTPSISFTTNETATTYYQWDSTTGTWLTTPPVVPEGTHTIYYYSINSAGIPETIKNQEIKVDTTAPILSNFNPANNSVVGSDSADSSLVGYWLFDEGGGSTAYDKSSANNNGTIYGATWTQGKYGQALSFDGIDDYMQVPNSTSLNITDQLTAEAWVKLSSLGNTQTIINKSVYNLNGWRTFIDGYNKINFEVINGMDYLIQSQESIDTNWHHFAFTYDGYNGKIYKDGKEIWAYLPHDNLSPVEYYGVNDSFSDSNGNRVWPWGVGVWAGNPSSYFDGGQVRLIGNSFDDANVLAIPGYSHKPKVKEGLDYTQSFDVKLENVQGNGARIIHQWFDANQNIIGTDYGAFETGTSDWHTLSLTKTAPVGAVRGNIIVQLYGSGTLSIKNPKFYLTDVNARKITTNTQNLTLGETTDHYWKFNGLIDDVKFYNRMLSATDIEASFLTNSKPTITANASDGSGSGIDSSSVLMKIDADNINASYAGGVASYAPLVPIIDGLHTARLDVKDMAGNSATQASWDFVVNTGTPTVGIENFYTYVPFNLGDGLTVNINPGNGNLIAQKTDASIPGRGIPIAVTRFYNSQSPYDSSYGKGWNFSFNNRLKDIGTGIVLIDGDGSQHYFAKNPDNTYSSPAGIYRKLVKNGDNTYTVTEKDQTKYNFDSEGKLKTIVDNNDNTTTYTYNSSTKKLENIQDPSGRQVKFTYSADGRLEKIIYPPNQATGTTERNIIYSYNGNGELTSVEDALGNITTYSYNANHKLTTINDAKNQPIYFEYNSDGKALKAIRPFPEKIAGFEDNEKWTITPASGGTLDTSNYKEGNQGLKLTSVNGSTVTASQDVSLNLATGQETTDYVDIWVHIDILDNFWNLDLSFYNNSTKATKTFSLGDFYGSNNGWKKLHIPKSDFSTSQTFWSNITKLEVLLIGNAGWTSNVILDGWILNKSTNPTTTFSYTGSTTDVTDPEGHTTNYEFNSVYNLTSLTKPSEPVGNKTTYTWNANNKTSETTDRRIIEYEYDSGGPITNGNVTKTTVKDKSNNNQIISLDTIDYDDKNNPVLQANKRGAKTTSVYDEKGNLINKTDGTGNTKVFKYDSYGNITKQTMVSKPSNSLLKNSSFEEQPTLFHDDFTRGSMAKWDFIKIDPSVPDTGDWVVDNGALYQRHDLSTGPDELYAVPEYLALAKGGDEWTNYSFSYIFSAVDERRQMGIIRYQDANNFYWWRIGAWNIIKLMKKQNGINYELGRAYFPDIPFNIPGVPEPSYRVTTTVNSGGISLNVVALNFQYSSIDNPVSYDRGITLTSTDTPISHGTIGVATDRVTRTKFDNFVVSKIEDTSLFEDNFSNGSMNKWSTYSSVPGGNWSVNGGKLYQSDRRQVSDPNQMINNDSESVPQFIATAGDSSWSNYLYSYTFTTEVERRVMGLAMVQDEKNFYWWRVGAWNNLKLGKRVNGFDILLAQAKMPNLEENGSTYKVKFYTTPDGIGVNVTSETNQSISVSGGDVTLNSNDGVNVFSTDQTFRTGKIGLATDKNTSVKFDDVVVKRLDSNWLTNGNWEWTGSENKFGNKAYKVESTSQTENHTAMQVVPVKPNTTYTLSTWVKTENVAANNNEGAFIGVYEPLVDTVYILESSTGTQDWKRISTNYTTASNASYLKVALGLKGSGKVYFDGVQIEEGLAMPSFNLLENGGFDLGTNLNGEADSWSFTSQPGSLVSLVDTGLKGEYYDNIDFTNLKITRTDPLINFNWYEGSPHEDLYPDEFSVRWTGRIKANYSNDYIFYTNTNDGVRLWLDNQEIITDWNNHSGAIENSSNRKFLRAGYHDIKMEYYDNQDNASAQLLWEVPSIDPAKPIMAKSIISSSYLYPDSEDKDTTYSGTRALKFKHNGSDGIIKAESSKQTVNKNKYTLSAYLKADNFNPNGANEIIVNYYDAGGNSLGQDSLAIDDGTYDWRRITKKLDLPAGTQKINLSVQIKSSTSTKIWIDSIVFEEGSNTTEYEYDTNENYPTKITDPLGNETKMAYDTVGNKTDVWDAKASSTNGSPVKFTYDALDRPVSIKDPKTRTVSYQYDKVGNKVKTWDTKASSTTPQGSPTIYTYNSYNLVESITDPTKNTVQNNYDKNGNLIKKTVDPGNKNYIATLTYDAQNRLKTATEPRGNIDPALYTTTYKYDSDGNQKEMIAKNKDGVDVVTKFDYNIKNQLTMITDPASQTITYEYDEVGNREKAIAKDSGGTVTRETKYSYDNDNRLYSEQDTVGSNKTTYYTYDYQGNRLSSTLDQKTTTFEYDDNQRITKTVDANNKRLTYIYDDINKEVKITDNQGIMTKYLFDEADKLTSVDTGTNRITNFTYNTNSGELEKTTHKNNYYTEYTYDNSGRLT